MKFIRDKRLESTLSGLHPKQLTIIKTDFGLTETELQFLITLRIKYQKNSGSLLKKLIPN